MARPKGYSLNREAFDDWLVARGLTRTEFASQADVALSTISGLTRPVEPKGAALPTALRMAEVLRVRPGSLFPELVGRTEAVAV